jgi:uncharacterized membrane protein YfcA
MKKLLVFALIGFLAQLVDGSLGMAYGLTSSSLLLMFGIAPAVASASVHLAEVVTTAASGVSHLKFGNVDKKIVMRLIIPGSIGAFIGALFLGSIPGDVIKPYISFILLGLGCFILYRFLFQTSVQKVNKNQQMSAKGLVPLGFVAGFVDSTGGGGWGPITTPVLLSRKNSEARKVIGSVDTSEFAVAISSTLGFMISIGWQQIHWQWVFALMLGGIIAAPLAAWLVKIIPSQLLGVLVGGMIIFTNVRTFITSYGISDTNASTIYGLLFLLWGGALIYAIVKLYNMKKQHALSELIE